MSRTVQCRKYQKELPGLAVPPYPGPKGQEVYETVSQQAWPSLHLERIQGVLSDFRPQLVGP